MCSDVSGDDANAFFREIDGAPMMRAKMGRIISRIFKRLIGLPRTTSTILRSLSDTVAARARSNGIITSTQLESVFNIAGHSSETSKQDYQMMEREEDVINSFAAYDAIYGNAGEAIVPIDDANNSSASLDLNTSITSGAACRMVMDSPSMTSRYSHCDFFTEVSMKCSTSSEIDTGSCVSSPSRQSSGGSVHGSGSSPGYGF